jgi:hypothetical protein
VSERSEGPLTSESLVLLDWIESTEPLSGDPSLWPVELADEAGSALTISEGAFATAPGEADLLAVVAPATGGALALRSVVERETSPVAPGAAGIAIVDDAAIIVVGTILVGTAIVSVALREDTRRNPRRYAAIQAAIEEGFSSTVGSVRDMAGKIADLLASGGAAGAAADVLDALREGDYPSDQVLARLKEQYCVGAGGAAAVASTVVQRGTVLLVACETSPGTGIVVPPAILVPAGGGSQWVAKVVLASFATTAPYLVVNGRSATTSRGVLQWVDHLGGPDLAVAVQWRTKTDYIPTVVWRNLP